MKITLYFCNEKLTMELNTDVFIAMLDKYKQNIEIETKYRNKI